MARQIKVSNSTHENLHAIKKANKTGSLDGAIRQMMEGCTTDLNVIKRNQTALTLNYEGYKIIDEKKKAYESIHNTELVITYPQLRKAEIGDIFEPETYPDEYYSYNIALVVYTDSEFVALKITTYKELPWLWDYKDIELIGVQLF